MIGNRFLRQMVSITFALLPLRLRYRLNILLGRYDFPNWVELGVDRLTWRAKNCARSKKILFATSSGAHRTGNLVESALAIALNKRGQDVSVTICDDVLPACNVCEYKELKPELDNFFKSGPSGIGLCGRCSTVGGKMWRELGIPIWLFSESVDQQFILWVYELSEQLSLDEMIHYKLSNGLNVGEHVKSSALRFLCRGTFDYAEAETSHTIKIYFRSVLIVAQIFETIYERAKPDVVICFHGIYSPHGVLSDLAKIKSIRVINWNTSYRKQRFLFCEGGTYHKLMGKEPAHKWSQIDLSSCERLELVKYLRSREVGTADWQQFNDNPQGNIEKCHYLVGFNPERPSVLLIPNVVWDAQLQYEGCLYESMIEWILDSIQTLLGQDEETQLLIRVHPAEIKRFSPTREPLMELINRTFPNLSRNIFVIPPDDNISTYRLADAVDLSIIYATKTGIELAARGRRVVVCGEAWITNQGFTVDPVSQDEYRNILRYPRGVSKMTNAEISLAEKFAYHFFFRRAIPLELAKPSNDSMRVDLNVSNLAELDKGNDPYLDLVCENIIEDKGFFIGSEKDETIIVSV